MNLPERFGKYTLVERIHTGRIAEVYLAVAGQVSGLEQVVVIKKVSEDVSQDEDFRESFLDEARITLALSHSNIVQVREVDEADGSYFLAMEYVSGRSLAQLFAENFPRDGRARIPFAAYVVSQLCRGLDHAHRRKDARGRELGVVHRAISPQNVLVSYAGEVKVIDFGTARAANKVQRTQVGVVRGEYGYLSPEQLLGDPVDRRADVYAAGVLLWELLTGRRLFDKPPETSIARPTPSPNEHNPFVPDELCAVVRGALTHAPGQRFGWASELEEALAPFLVHGGQAFGAKALASQLSARYSNEIAVEERRLQQASVQASRVPRGGTQPKLKPPTEKPFFDDDDGPTNVGLDAAAILGEKLPPISSAPPVMSPGHDDGESDEPHESTQVVDFAEMRKQMAEADAKEAAEKKAALGAKAAPTGKHPVGGAAPAKTGNTGKHVSPPATGRHARPTVSRAVTPDAPVPAVVAPPPPEPTPEPAAELAPEVAPQPAPEVAPQPAPPPPAPVAPVAAAPSPSSRLPIFAGLGVFTLIALSGLGYVLFSGGEEPAPPPKPVVVAPPPPPKPAGMAQVKVSYLPKEANAQVTIGGRLATTDAILRLPPGDYDLVAQAKGYKTFTQRISVLQGEEVAQFTALLEPDEQVAVPAPAAPDAGLAAVVPAGVKDPPVRKPPPAAKDPNPQSGDGYLVATTDPDGAMILLDGLPSGRSTPVGPKNKLFLSPGAHTITFCMAGLCSKHFDVTVQPGKPVTLKGVTLDQVDEL